MEDRLTNDWLVKWDLELKRKIVLLVDNCTAHTNSSLLKNIKVIFLPANTTSLIQPRDRGIIRAFKAHYRREMRVRIVAELDDIQDQSDASAVGFSKTNAETPPSEESDLTSEILDQAPGGMSKEFENSLDIDNNAEAVATVTVSEICQAVVMINPN